MRKLFFRESRSIISFIDRFFRKIFIYIVRLYQLTLSHFFGNSCRFHPSCSHYALHALKQKSFFSALFLIGKRISKCHPYHPGGYDPVQ